VLDDFAALALDFIVPRTALGGGTARHWPPVPDAFMPSTAGPGSDSEAVSAVKGQVSNGALRPNS
jgi:hypothetical protein